GESKISQKNIHLIPLLGQCHHWQLEDKEKNRRERPCASAQRCSDAARSPYSSRNVRPTLCESRKRWSVETRKTTGQGRIQEFCRRFSVLQKQWFACGINLGQNSSMKSDTTVTFNISWHFRIIWYSLVPNVCNPLTLPHLICREGTTHLSASIA